MNLYDVYRLVIFLITLYNIGQFILTLSKYKKYYDRLPNWLQKYFLKKGMIIIEKQLKEQKKELIINGVLLGILIFLNLVLLSLEIF